MEQICPLCNGLKSIHQYCPVCGQTLADGGSLQDFYGPYSPYIEQNAYGDLAMTEYHGICVHLLYCPACGYDRREQIGQVEM